ncbi:MAG: DUF4080 domain-containing protein [Verrucomicrobia bacterium]|jgi:radical SAM superfamily enzyme YgiQ (UPF0313 family)|nr:DUF4080 domain-containing protein [Verrucomicrobiota bacterium]
MEHLTPVRCQDSMQGEILLVTLNAKYIHASFGLRYLHANMGELKDRTRILEFDINQKIGDIAEQILKRNPSLVGFGVYIWNVDGVSKLIAILKQLNPQLKLVVGGPEVSFEIETQKWLDKVDYIITGEADIAFSVLCHQLINSPDSTCDIPKQIRSQLPVVKDIQLPYELYSDQDIKHRIVYVEASRGCPFTCEFCLSSLDVPVRAFPLESFLTEIDRLYTRGLRHFKFVDRTFNLNIQTGKAILGFFLQKYVPGMFLHFEMIPDRLPEPLRELIAKFPSGAIQFEIGIQTFNPVVSENISRRQDLVKLEDNLKFLRTQTGVHLHVDLIAGLPGETMDSFGNGFDRLIGLNPQEIQIGILKRLRGTPIVRHDSEFQMIYDSNAPYEVLRTRDFEFIDLQRIKRFARYWDLVGNSGNFVDSVSLFWESTKMPFFSFMAFSDWLYLRTGQRHGIALTRLVAFIFEYLTSQISVDSNVAAKTLWKDYQRAGRSDQPIALRPYLEEIKVNQIQKNELVNNNFGNEKQLRQKRQQKHTDN